MTVAVETSRPTERVRIELLFLDLETCDRCRGTDRNLEFALELVRDSLAASGTKAEVEKIHVTSAAQARDLRFQSSPTLRVNGRDVALELRESSCGSEACTDGRGDSIACRVWVHAGEEHTEPPVEMIVAAILGAVDRAAKAEPEPAAEPYRLPRNLERFFAGQGATAAAAPADPACCSPAEQSSCCDPADKAECCGDSSGGACGCR